MKTERSVGFVFISILLLSMFDLLSDGCQNHNKFLSSSLRLEFNLILSFISVPPQQGEAGW